MVRSPEPPEPDTSAAAMIGRAGWGVLCAVLFLVAIQVLAIGLDEAAQRVSDGLRAMLTV